MRDAGFKFGLAAVITWVLVVLGFWAAVIYIVLHFIAKFW